MGNKNSYTQEFFEELFEKLNLKEASKQSDLRKVIISAGDNYLRWSTYPKTQLPAYAIQKELEKAISYIEKAQASIDKVHLSGNYDRAIAESFYNVIRFDYPSLHSIKNEIKDPNCIFGVTENPRKINELLSVMTDGIKYALKYYPLRKTMNKSRPLNFWILLLSPKLEPIIGHKLEQSRYYKGEYFSKREIGDSALLLSIIKPIDPTVTISQIETAIKETHKERHAQKIF